MTPRKQQRNRYSPFCLARESCWHAMARDKMFSLPREKYIVLSLLFSRQTVENSSELYLTQLLLCDSYERRLHLRPLFPDRIRIWKVLIFVINIISKFISSDTSDSRTILVRSFLEVNFVQVPIAYSYDVLS